MPYTDDDKRRATARAYYHRNKARLRAKQTAYRKQNHAALLARSRKLYNDNSLKRKEQAKKYRVKRKNKTTEYNKMYYAANREKERIRHKAYRNANKEKIQLYYSDYRRINKEPIAVRNEKRRAQKLASPINDFTSAQWLKMQHVFGHRCAYCGKRYRGKLTQDHITPLSKGGSHTASNIVPACRSCNSRKNSGPVLKAIQPLLLL